MGLTEVAEQEELEVQDEDRPVTEVAAEVTETAQSVADEPELEMVPPSQSESVKAPTHASQKSKIEQQIEAREE